MSEGEAWRTITGIAAGIDRVDAHLSQLEATVSELAEAISRLTADQVAAGLPEEADVTNARVIAELAALYRDHLRWAVWLPAPSGQWAAARPAGSRPPSPGVPMIWVHADSASGLGARMDQADESLTPS